MAASQTITIHKPLDEAVPAVKRALLEAGFDEVQTDEDAHTVEARKGQRFQWSKGEVSVILSEAGAETSAEVVSSAKAQSIPSVVSSPAERIVKDAVEALSAL